MSDAKNELPENELHEIAGGWITERKNTPVPGFLKLAYVGFGAFGLCLLDSLLERADQALKLWLVLTESVAL